MGKSKEMVHPVGLQKKALIRKKREGNFKKGKENLSPGAKG
jgi:hypothetical protein